MEFAFNQKCFILFDSNHSCLYAGFKRFLYLQHEMTNEQMKEQISELSKPLKERILHQ